MFGRIAAASRRTPVRTRCASRVSPRFTPAPPPRSRPRRRWACSHMASTAVRRCRRCSRSRTARTACSAAACRSTAGAACGTRSGVPAARCHPAHPASCGSTHRLASSSIWKIRQQPHERSTPMACSAPVISLGWPIRASSLRRGSAMPCASVVSWSAPRRSRPSFRRSLAWRVYRWWRPQWRGSIRCRWHSFGPADGAELDEAALRARCLEQLARFKVPERIVVVRIVSDRRQPERPQSAEGTPARDGRGAVAGAAAQPAARSSNRIVAKLAAVGRRR